MIRAAIRGAGYDNLKRALRERLPFRTSGSLSGETREVVGQYGFFEAGYLRGADLDRFEADRDRITYIVRSYLTPIAWVTEDGTVHNVAQKFSVTTSRHQSEVRAWL